MELDFDAALEILNCTDSIVLRSSRGVFYKISKEQVVLDGEIISERPVLLGKILLNWIEMTLTLSEILGKWTIVK